MGELILSQPIEALLGGVANDRDIFTSSKARLVSAMERAMGMQPMEPVGLARATEGMSDEETFWFNYHVSVQVGFLHPEIRSIATPRFMLVEHAVDGDRIHFQIEGHFQDGRAGVSTVTFCEHEKVGRKGVTWESSFGEPEEVGRIDDAVLFDLKDVKTMPEQVRERFEYLVIWAALHDHRREPELTTFEGSETYVGIYRRVNATGQNEIVMQHPGERTSTNGTLVTLERAVFYPGKDPDINSPIEVRYESVLVDEV